MFLLLMNFLFLRSGGSGKWSENCLFLLLFSVVCDFRVLIHRIKQEQVLLKDLVFGVLGWKRSIEHMAELE